MITNQMIFLYLFAVNLLAFSLFGIDKWKAVHHKWRIQEAALLGCSFAGGALGALLAMHLFRHKTHKPRFWVGVRLMLAVQIVLLIYLKL